MSGRRWIFILLAAVPVSITGCQVDGGTRTMWNPFVRADKSDTADDEQLPKFVRRVTEDEDEKQKQKNTPIAESRVEALIAEGQRALQDNRIADARRAYDEVLQFLPDDPTAHHGLAMASDLTEQWADAEDHYRQALRSRPRDANLLCDIGYSYLLQNRYSEASSYLSQAVQINPNHENAHSNLALLDVRQGNREAARQRLMQRYEDQTKVTQILAALESQTAARAATTLAATAPVVPENATLEEIRELANRERIAGEQRRAALTVPPDYNDVVSPVSAARHTDVPGRYDAVDLQGTRQQPAMFSRTDADPASTGTQPTERYPLGNLAAANHASNLGDPMVYTTPPGFGSSSGMASQSNPATGNFTENPAYANTGVSTGFLSPDSMSTQHAMTWQNPNGNSAYSADQFPPGSYQQPVAAGNPFPQTTNSAAGSGGVVAVRPSGSFQPPTTGVSYGQPYGFGQTPAGTASYQNNVNAAARDGNTLYGDAAYENMPGPRPTNVPGQQNSNTDQQYPNAGQHNSHIQLDGLNAGPGALFPIGQGSTPPQGTLRMENVSAPGSNSVINGAMYGQPVSTLPAQEWMMQQQQQIQQLNSQSQPMQNGIPYGNPGTTTAPRPGSQTQSVSPLATFENQLRQLDNQYNSTLQQLDHNASEAIPRAQY